jgi:hypothetical protein
LLEPPEETDANDWAEDWLLPTKDEKEAADEQKAHCGRPGLDTQQPQVLQALDDEATVVQEHIPAIHWPVLFGHSVVVHAVLGGA